MRMPRTRLTRAALRRPAVLAPVTTLALAALLASGLVVARAVDPGPTTAVDATASPAPGGSTTSGGDDNTAVAVNTKDGSTVYALRLKVRILNNDPATVDSTNAAVAVSSCADCQTVAIALEGIVITGEAEVIAPVNLALAVNNGCSSCQTLADAYQNVQTFDGRARMTGSGRQQVARLRQDLNELRGAGLSLDAIRAEVDRIAAAFAEVLRTEIVHVGKPQPETSAPAASPEGQTAATSPAPVPTSSPEAAESPEPSQPTGAPSTPAPSPTGG